MMFKKAIASLSLLAATTGVAIPPPSASLIQSLVRSGELQALIDQEARNLGPNETIEEVNMRRIAVDRTVIHACGQTALSRSAAAIAVEMQTSNGLVSEIYITAGSSSNLSKCTGSDFEDSPFS